MKTILGNWPHRLIFRRVCLQNSSEASFIVSRLVLGTHLKYNRYFLETRSGTQLVCCSAASRRRCLLAYVQDGFPQQRSWSDRTGTRPGATAEPSSDAVTLHFVDATRRGRRSFVAHHENRNAHSRLYRRAEALPRRLYHRACRSAGSGAASAAATPARRMPSRADLRPRTSRRRTRSPPPARSSSTRKSSSARSIRSMPIRG